MLENHATLARTRSYLETEICKKYPTREASSIARMIMEHTGYPSSIYLSDPHRMAGSGNIMQINKIVAEIHTGRPIQYILGYTHFCDLRFELDEHVLIPRPETEEMIYQIRADTYRSGCRMIDLGTGSGCIALSLKKYFPGCEVYALEKSRPALIRAKENGRLLNLDVTWIFGDMLQQQLLQVEEKFDLVVSNPPYVRKSERMMMDDNVLLHEPGMALFVEDQDPLIFYRAIRTFCLSHLRPGGILWVEINEKLGEETAALFTDAGFLDITIRKDIHKKDRFITASLPAHGI